MEELGVFFTKTGKKLRFESQGAVCPKTNCL